MFSSSGFLQFISFSISNEKRSVETTALCDTISTVSFIDQTSVSFLKLKGRESVILVAGTHGLSDIEEKS